MDAEKELLLKLLMEKHGQPVQESQRVKATKSKRNRNYLMDHKWTAEEKATLLGMRNQGASFEEIARVLNLRPNQCRSMYSNLPMHGKRVI